MRHISLFFAPFLFACTSSGDPNEGGTAMTDDGLPPDGELSTGGTVSGSSGGSSAGGPNTGGTGGDVLSETGGTTSSSGGATGGTHTGGTGGSPTIDGPPLPSCDVEIEDRGDVIGCESTVEGLQVKFFWPQSDLPLPVPLPRRLGVYLHGDGGGDWDNSFYIEQLAEWAVPNDILIVAPLSPGIHDDGSNRWWVDSEITVPMLQETLRYFVDAYGLMTDTVFYAGVSGGSQFMNAQWLHRAGHEFPGAFAHNCGGTDPSTRYPWAWDTSDVALRDQFALHFNYGSEDFLAPQSEDAIADFGALGFVVTSVVHPGAEHCAHEIVQPTIDFWSTQLD